MKSFKKLAWGWCIVAALPTVVIVATRWLGWLQPLEWTALDLYFQLRPRESVDSRILIVGFEEKDIQTLKQSRMSDQVLAKLLTKIKQQNPRVIGLDIYRDIPEGDDYEELVKIFRTTPNLIGVETVIGDKFNSKISPSPILKHLNQVAAVDTVVDGDDVVRRALLYPKPTTQNLGLAVALIYLKAQGFTDKASVEGFMQIGNAVFKPLEKNAGSYIGSDVREGYQILLNFRGPAQSFPQVSVTDVLADRIPPDLMRDRIVLIGATAPSLKDLFSTPYSWNLNTTPINTSGVEIQANIASQVISSVLDNRPLISVLNEPVELLWIVSWSALIIILGWIWRRASDTKNFATNFFFRLTISSVLAAVAVVGISYLSFLLGWWIPVVPPLLSLLCSPLLISNYTYIRKLNEREHTLEVKVEERTQDLRFKNQQLKDAQNQIIAQERLAFLGTIMAGIAHELKQPLNLINNFAEITIILNNELQEEIEKQSQYLVVEVINSTSELLADIEGNVLKIKNQSQRASKIMDSMLSHTRQESFDAELTDINSLVSSTTGLVYYSLKTRFNSFKINIKANYDGTIEQINIVAQDISRALINIIDNACQSVYKKMKIVDEEFEPELLVETKNLGNAVEIKIKDNGQGIPNDIRDEIFKPFFTTKPPEEGTGLGLYLAHDIIIGKHKGKIEVETQSGNYTEFTIILPKDIKFDDM